MTAQAASRAIGLIGLGAIGAPLAGHLVDAGHRVSLYARRAEVARAVAAAAGAQSITALEALIESSQVLILCVSADGDVKECIAAITTLARRQPLGLKLVIDHSTVAPATARAAAEALANFGIDFVDAPVSGGAEGARRGALAIMAGGTESAVSAASEIFGAYASRWARLGPVGSGQAAKAVNQVLVAGIAEAVCEGLALAEAMDLPASTLLPMLNAGAAGNWFLEHRGESMLAGSFAGGFRCDLLMKDLGIVADLQAEHGLVSRVIDGARADYRELAAGTHASDDISALFSVKAAR